MIQTKNLKMSAIIIEYLLAVSEINILVEKKTLIFISTVLWNENKTIFLHNN